MVLANVSTHDFDLFLSILYPTSFGVHPASTVEEWSGILYLADKWSFLSIRTLAIAQMAPIASPIDNIVFGRLYDINEWLIGAYQVVCTRLDALTLEEGRRLGVDDAIRINSIRQDFCFVRVSEASPKLCEEDIESRFGLAMQMEHSASRESMKNVANGLKPYNAAEATSKKEEAAKAAAIERKKRAQEAADKQAKDLEDKRVQDQREAEATSKKEADAKAAEIEQKKKREQEAADKKMKDMEEKKVREQREAVAADIERKKTEAAAAAAKHQKDEAEQKARESQEKKIQDKCETRRKLKEDGEAKAPIKSSKSKEKAKPTAAMSGISDTSIDTAANEQEDWSKLDAWDRRCRKKAKIEKERDTEELADLVKQMKQQLADEVKAAEGGATQQGAGGTSDVSITEQNGTSGVSKTSIGTPAIKKDDWSHLTPSERYEKKLGRIDREYWDENRAEEAAKHAAELLEKAKQQMADEAKAVEEAAAQ
ncbi:hypothetical protein FIBSPDRAFT_1049697 [Athelia psychrophila]|uniref:BTB domain-containing protein n=1 Tax=Athelia psychrophila TaxID=1759441 RepID=A0A166BUB5_9AGAM|nr:hypothetical protein FIBSPDRAFT_1049697 [Fibularhizoctonia sp. CBS 109695]